MGETVTAKHEWVSTGELYADGAQHYRRIVCMMCGKVDRFVAGTEVGAIPGDPREATDCPKPAPTTPKPIPPSERTVDPPARSA